jgi:hypothetical protein
VWALLPVLAFVVVAVALWWMLLDWVYSKIRPRIERYIWRKVGGEGDLPADVLYPDCTADNPPCDECRDGHA